MKIHIGRNGVQEGPYTVEEILAKLATGEVTPQTLAWTQGMGEWRPLSEVLPESAGAPSIPSAPVAPTPAAARGRMSTNDEFLADASAIAKDRYGLAFGATFISGLLEGVAGSIPCGIGVVLRLLLCAPFEIGRVFFAMKYARRENPPAEIGDIFAGFRTFGRSMSVYWYMTVFVLLWLLPALGLCGAGIAGVIANEKGGHAVAAGVGVIALATGGLYGLVVGAVVTYRYALYLYLAKDHPESGCAALLDRSIALMHGHKWRLFVVGFCLVWKQVLALYVMLAVQIGTIFGAVKASEKQASGLALIFGLAAFVAFCGLVVAIYAMVRAQIRLRVAGIRFYDELVWLEQRKR